MYEPKVTFTAFDKGNGDVLYATGNRVFTLYQIMNIGATYEFARFAIKRLRVPSASSPPYESWGNTSLATLHIAGGYGNFLAPPDWDYPLETSGETVYLNNAGIRVIFMTDAPSSGNFVPLGYVGASLVETDVDTCPLAGTLDWSSILKYQ